MANLLHIVLALVEDPEARRTLRTDPDELLGGIDDVCGEDVAAVVDVVRAQVAPEVASRLDGVIAIRPPAGADPADAARRSLLALCDAVDGPDGTRAGGPPDVRGHPWPDRPGHLWAVQGGGDVSHEDGDGDEEPAPERPPLAPVPDPPGGFEFSPLELVRLPVGVPDAGIEPGALATVVAVHRDPELHYEIEVSDEDGGRRFLGTVPPSSLARY